MTSETSCFFTGHRHIPPFVASRVAVRLEDEMTRLYHLGVRRFISGGAVGFDMLAAEQVLRLKKNLPDLRLVMALPSPDYHTRWQKKDKLRLVPILRQADDTIFVSPFYTNGCLHMRNRFMAEHAKFGISYLTKPSGGTYYTVHYALSLGCDVVNIADTLGLLSDFI